MTFGAVFPRALRPAFGPGLAAAGGGASIWAAWLDHAWVGKGATVYRYIVPVDIMQACIEMASYTNNNRMSGGIKRETIAEYTVEYGGQEMTSNAARILTAYRRIGV